MNKAEIDMLLDIAGRSDAAVWRPFREPTNDAVCFAGDVACIGLPWKCSGHAGRKTLAALAAAGLVHVQGQTNRVRVRMTPETVLATWAGIFGVAADPVKLIGRIAGLKTVRDPYGRDIVLGRTIAKRGDMGKLSLTLVPAILCGWIETAHSVGTLWGATVTDAGRTCEIGDLPDIEVDDDAFERFEQAVDQGFRATVPHSGNSVARMLPAGGW